MVVIGLSAACVGVDPVMAPMPGCYEVAVTPAWSTFVSTTGLPGPPSVVGIDTNPDRYVLVPPEWRTNGGRDYNAAGWTEYTMDYSILGDSVYRYGDKRHRMADDSMIVNIGGSKGGLTAYLQLTDAGFEGRFFTTTMYREKGPSGRMVLTRADCTGRALISGRAPVDVKEPPSH